MFGFLSYPCSLCVLALLGKALKTYKMHWEDPERSGGEGGREVGVIRMGNTCKSMADSCQVWQKQLQYCKVISLQLIKINGKK